MREAGAADIYRLIVIAGAPAFFSELRKSNRRRVRLDPASQFDNSLSCSVTRRSSSHAETTLWSRNRYRNGLADHCDSRAVQSNLSHVQTG